MKSSLFAALTALVGIAAAMLPAAAIGSGPVPVEVRVVTFKGKVLAERKIRTGTTTVRTSTKAKCLGASKAERKKIPGPTALGALVDLGERVARVDSLLLSGGSEFGIGVCGIGSAVATGKQWWALKVNGKFSSSGGDSTKLKRGDRVLWYLDRSYDLPFPGELRLRVIGASKRSQVKVKVISLDGDGKRSAVGGAKVFAGGSEAGVTNRKGQTTLRMPSNGRSKVSLVARLAGYIPSNRLEVRNGS
jgi:hypothetical protein